MKKKIAVTFPIFKSFGGAELVSLEICNFLSKKFNVELIFYKSEINNKLKFKNNYKINIIRSKNKFIDFLCSNIVLCAQVYLIYYLNKNQKSFDYVFSSSGEIISKLPVIQLVHHPFFSLKVWHYSALGIKPIQIHKILARFILTIFLRIIFGISKKKLKKNYTVCNSKWSKQRYNSAFGLNANQHLYCTFDLGDPLKESFDEYEKRNDDFVMIGRVSKDKRIEEAISVFKSIHEINKNFKGKLHIIGTGRSKYISYLKSKCINNKIIFHGFLDEKDKNRILLKSKYGLHLFRYEHFGIAPCEMQNSGVLCFVYDKGGPAEIIQPSSLKFKSKKDLVKKINNIILDSNKRATAHYSIKNQTKIFTKKSFYETLENIILQFKV
tara:strand:- start:1900 stop:3045 length:1146 start_codon:yes stop_codon:yes gene_type:complete